MSDIPAIAAPMTMSVSAFTVGRRFRKDMGDLGGLARSIEREGLLHPVVVSQRGVLLAGERRLRACRDILGWTQIPVTIIREDDA